jgi:hypothetical protein
MRETPLLQACYRGWKRETCANTYSQSYPLYPQSVDKDFHNLGKTNVLLWITLGLRIYSAENRVKREKSTKKARKQKKRE